VAKLNFMGGKLEVIQDGVGLSGGLVYFYEPGTTTPKDTYTTSGLDTANANPVVLDADGRAAIWLANEDYKVVLKDSAGNTIYTVDNLNPATTTTSSSYNLQDNGSFEDGVDSSGFPISWVTTEWGTVSIDSSDQQHGAKSFKGVSTGAGGGWIQSESFFEVDDGRVYQLNFRIKSSVADVRNLVQIKWYDSAQASVSTESVYDDSTTNPTSWTLKNYIITPPSTARYGKLELYACHSSDATAGTTWFDDVVFSRHYSAFPAVIKSSDIASASTLTLTNDGNYFDVTGTTTITAISGDQTFVILEFDDALTLTHHATNLYLPGAANITTAAGDRATFVQTSVGWECTCYSRASGLPLSETISGASDGAGLTLLRSQTASASSSLDFDTNITSAYDHYMFTFEAISPATDGADFWCRVGPSSTVDTGASDYNWSLYGAVEGAVATGGSATDSKIAINTSSIGSVATEVLEGRFFVNSPSSSSIFTSVDWRVTYRNSAGNLYVVSGGGQRAAAQADDIVQFRMSSGNIASGVIRLYGIEPA